MTTGCRTTIALLVLALGAAACRDYMPENRFLRPRTAQKNLSTADAQRKFDHAAHAPVLEKAGVPCNDCHRFDARITTSNPSLAAAVSAKTEALTVPLTRRNFWSG